MKRLKLSDYLRMLRCVAGYSQRTVAGWLGMTPAAYSHYETERNSSINNDYLAVLSRHYGVHLDTLLQMEGVDIDELNLRPPVTPAENLASFLMFYCDPDIRFLYRFLDYDQKWCLFYFKNCQYKRELLSLMSAAPEVIPLLYL